VAQALDLDEPAIGGKADLAQLGQIAQAPTDAEVVAVVDGGFGAQRPMFLVILLDPGVLVMDVQGGGDVLGEDSGSELSRGPAGDPAVEDQLDLFWTTQIEVLADHLLEEHAAMHRSVEHLGQGELGLEDREVEAIAGLAIRAGERVGQST